MASNFACPTAGMAPIKARSSVVLPAPLRPIKPHISPSSRSSAALRTIGMGPIDTLSSLTLSIGSPMRGRGCQLGSADERLDAGIAQRVGWISVGDHGAVVEGEHAVGEARDDLHVVL